MESSDLLALQWVEHASIFSRAIGSLRGKDVYTDATLGCDGRFFPVHKFVLSTCSEYFSAIFDWTPCVNPVIVINNVACKELEALLDFMYIGEVSIKESQIPDVMRAAECLRIRGLSMVDDEGLRAQLATKSSKDCIKPPRKRKRSEPKKKTQTTSQTQFPPPKHPAPHSSTHLSRSPIPAPVATTSSHQSSSESNPPHIVKQNAQSSQSHHSPSQHAKLQLNIPGQNLTTTSSVHSDSASDLPSPPLPHSSHQLAQKTLQTPLPPLSSQHPPQTPPLPPHKQHSPTQQPTTLPQPSVTVQPPSSPHTSSTLEPPDTAYPQIIVTQSHAKRMSPVQLTPAQNGGPTDHHVTHRPPQEASLPSTVAPIANVIQAVKLELDSHKQEMPEDGTVSIPEFFDTLVDMRPLYDGKTEQEEVATFHAVENNDNLYDFTEEFPETSTSTSSSSSSQAQFQRGHTVSSGVKIVKKATAPTGEFKCHICKKVYLKKDNLNRHVATHKEPKEPYSCQSCDFTAHIYKDMLAHRKETHSLHKCNICDFSTKRMDSMKRHMVHHTGVTHKCPQCNFVSKSKDYINRHFKRNHKKE